MANNMLSVILSLIIGFLLAGLMRTTNHLQALNKPPFKTDLKTPVRRDQLLFVPMGLNGVYGRTGAVAIWLQYTLIRQ